MPLLKHFMEKIQKFLRKLTQSEQEKISALLLLILQGNINALDIKKLKGHRDIFRVRSGSIRIIFKRTENDILVLEIGRRNEQTYRDF